MNEIHTGVRLYTGCQIKVVNFNRHEDKHIINLYSYLVVLPGSVSYFSDGYSTFIVFVGIFLPHLQVNSRKEMPGFELA